MTDNRITTWAGQVQELFMADIKADPLPATALEALSKTDLVPENEGSNTFRVYTRPFVRMDRESLETFRARGSNTNPLASDTTNGGQIVSKAFPNKYETLTVDTVSSIAFDIDVTAGVDSKFNSPEELTARARKTLADSFAQEKHEIILSNALSSGEYVVASTAEVSLGVAVTAGDVTFELTDLEKASSGIAVGDIVKIGDALTPNADDGIQEILDIGLVSVVGADGTGTGANSLITISTTPADFPKGRNSLSPVVFDKIVIALTAHDSGARVQIDKPQTASVESIDSIFDQILVAASNNFIDLSNLVVYTTPEVQQLLYGTKSSGVRSPFVANDILGAQVLKTGIFAQGVYRGIQIVADANALARIDAISTTDLASARHYIWCFEKNESIAYASLLEGVAMDQLEGRAGLLWKLSAAYIHDSMMPRAGKIRSFILPVTVS